MQNTNARGAIKIIGSNTRIVELLIFYVLSRENKLNLGQTRCINIKYIFYLWGGIGKIINKRWV